MRAISGTIVLLLLCAACGKATKQDRFGSLPRYTSRLDISSDWAKSDAEPVGPVTIELDRLTWDGTDLECSAVFHNPSENTVSMAGGKGPLSVKVKDRRYYPFVDIQVSDSRESKWETVGQSPKSRVTKPYAEGIVPDSREREARQRLNEVGFIDLNAFRPYVAKRKFGRVVAPGSGSSQVFPLEALLPGWKN